MARATTPVNVIFEEGDILTESAFCNPVNLVGAMGRGLALAVAQRWPDVLADYRLALGDGRLAEGTVHEWRRPDGGWILQGPTKRHWRDKSPVELVRKTIGAIGPACTRLGIRRIAVPPLGCGLGGLRPTDVLPMLLKAAADNPSIEWRLYRLQPGGEPRRRQP